MEVGLIKYLTGDEVLVGDRINAWGSNGVVVHVNDTRQGSDEHLPGTWDYLKTGMMIETDEMGLVHCSEPDEEIVLICRSEVDEKNSFS